MKASTRLYFIITSITLASCNQPKKYGPDLYFTKEIQVSIIEQSVRYSAKLAPLATHEDKFNAEFNEYYDRAAEETDFRQCFPDGNKSYFFLMTRKARSIWPTREAIGGKITIDENNRLEDYEEIFRTWKMSEDSLNERAFELFDRMVKKEDLTPFRSKHKGDLYIEFPDDRYYFNTEKKRWSDKVMDSAKQIN